MGVERVPLKTYGKLDEWDTYPSYGNVRWDTNVRFEAHMEVTGMYSGRSAKGACVTDKNTGKEYHMFMTDLIKALRALTVDKGVFPVMEWEACKRGMNYGIRPVLTAKK